MRQSLLILTLLFAGEVFASPASATTAAYADAVKLPSDAVQYARYLSTDALVEGDKVNFLKTLTFHVNSISREGDFGPLVRVAPDLYRVDLRDFGWKAEVWDKLPDPYFLDLQQPREHRGVRFFADGAWCGPDAAKLDKLTDSYVPVVRADWFFAQTAIQVGRGGAGYYDFLGLKSRADAEDLCGLDRVKARKLSREIAAIVADSGVALNNRQLLRFQAITGGYWSSLDANSSTGVRNALRLLDGDFTHDAEEIYFVLPNGLFGTYASDAAGKGQDSVPDNIASDARATANDKRVHPGLSCIRCHEAGLKPVDDWARKFYSADTLLQSPDYEKLKRLKRLYLSDLDGELKKDVEAYAAVLKRCNGRTSEEQSRAYGEAWQAYSETGVTGEQFARELGTTPAALKAALFGYSKRTGALDPVLLGYLKAPELPARREHVEEVYGLAATILGEVK